MIDGDHLAAELHACGITHVVWLPDSEIGLWEHGLRQSPQVQLVRVCREGEAIVLAAGLSLGGKRPLVIIQCTGLFEAGDAVRNVVHDLKIPLLMIVGVRSYTAFQAKGTADTCPVFTEPILQAWKIPFVWLRPDATAKDVALALRHFLDGQQSGCVLIPE